MKTAISFAKDAKLQNILFDEYFAEHQMITVIAFNYDGAGTALCRCDGGVAEIKKANIRKIILGAEKTALENYLLGIFDPDAETDEIQRLNGEPIFRMPELNKMKKYDIANLAKQTLQSVQSRSVSRFHYYTLTDDGMPAENSGQQGQ